MEPTIKDGSIVLASSIPYFFSKPAIDDIVVYHNKNKTIFVKRIKKKDHEKYFLVGDNEKDSLDSRKLGWIDRKDIVGKRTIGSMPLRPSLQLCFAKTGGPGRCRHGRGARPRRRGVAQRPPEPSG